LWEDSRNILIWGKLKIIGWVVNFKSIFKQKDRIYDPVFCYLSLKAILSSTTFKSAIGHVRAVTAVCSNNTTATVYDMVTTRFRC